jgi:hypothetical protein
MKYSSILRNSFYKTHMNKFVLLFVTFLLFEASSYAQTNGKTTLQNNIIMCNIMPGTEVASKAPFTIPFKAVETWPTVNVKTGCRYIFKNDTETAAITIGLTDLVTQKNAFASYTNAYQASKDLWEEAPAIVVALQDTGFFSGKDECGLKFHLGKYILDINFKGQFNDVSDEQKKAAGIVLAEILMDRLRYLWKGK